MAHLILRRAGVALAACVYGFLMPMSRASADVAEGTYTLRIRVVDGRTGRPVSDVRYGMFGLIIGGGTVHEVVGSPTTTADALKEQKGNLGPRGEATLRLTKGRYSLTLSHPDFSPKAFVMTVPPPSLKEGETEIDFVCSLGLEDRLPLAVKVVRADNNEPVRKATVHVREFGPGALALPDGKETDEKGLTKVFRLKQVDPAEKAGYRVEVTASGFRSKSVDVPAEHYMPKGPRTLVVKLEKGRLPFGMTEAEYASWERLKDWGRKRPETKDDKGERTGPNLPIQDTTLHVHWQETRTVGGKAQTIRGSVSMTYVEHKPGDSIPAETPRRDEEPGAIGPHAASVSTKLHYARWRQGWFVMTAGYNSQYPFEFTREEVLKLANEVAGVVGDPGK